MNDEKQKIKLYLEVETYLSDAEIDELQTFPGDAVDMMVGADESKLYLQYENGMKIDLDLHEEMTDEDQEDCEEDCDDEEEDEDEHKS